MRDHEYETTAHLTAEEDHAMRTMSAYEQLLSRLSGGGRDFWDRPDGGWGERQREEVLGEAETERRADANSAYVIGSKALRRDELDNARAWFAVAADAEHPGAAFRSALTAARKAAMEDISACHNLLRATQDNRERTEVWRWLRIAADWGHGDARHLIGTLSESAGCATGLGADGDGDDGEAPAPVRPVRVEDTEFYDELHTFLLFPGHGERPEPGQEPEAEPARPGEVIGAEDAGQCSVVPMESAGAVPDRSGAPLLPAYRIRRVLDERRMIFVLVAACGEDVPAASGWSGERVRERLALAAWRPVASWQQVARGWVAGWSGLRAELPPAVVTCELQEAAARPLVWLVLNGDRSAVEAAGARHLPGAATVPSSLRSCMQDSTSRDALDRVGDTDLWQECARWLSSAGSGVTSRLLYKAQAEAERAQLRLRCVGFPAREPAWWVVLAHVGWPELDTVVNAGRDADHGDAHVSDCRCARCARARPDGRLPQARSRPNTP
ncbi:hypothetical protein [Streptomyces sp. NPDC051657]|uniref:hypothetical protein n=1 Tax=unclassified Streptomyces TaxID=2593676 RepID=UPI00341EBC2F